MRLDLFLHWSGVVRRRSEARRVCDESRVRVDGRLAKAARPVEVGAELAVERGERIRRWRVTSLPGGAMPRSRMEEFVELVADEALEAPSGDEGL